LAAGPRYGTGLPSLFFTFVGDRPNVVPPSLRTHRFIHVTQLGTLRQDCWGDGTISVSSLCIILYFMYWEFQYHQTAR